MMHITMVMAVVAVGLSLGAGFVACGQVSSRSEALSPGDSGVKGLVVAAPSCPVETSESPCPPQRVQADVEVLAITPSPRVRDVADGEKNLITVAHADSDGRFQINLAPGTYVLQGVPPSHTTFDAKPISVEVEAHTFTEVTVILDTGIR